MISIDTVFWELQIGLMRNGRILAENKPETLMQEHSCSSLEEVFLKLCRQELILNDYGDEDEVVDMVKYLYSIYCYAMLW